MPRYYGVSLLMLVRSVLTSRAARPSDNNPGRHTVQSILLSYQQDGYSPLLSLGRHQPLCFYLVRRRPAAPSARKVDASPSRPLFPPGGLMEQRGDIFPETGGIGGA